MEISMSGVSISVNHNLSLWESIACQHLLVLKREKLIERANQLSKEIKILQVRQSLLYMDAVKQAYGKDGLEKQRASLSDEIEKLYEERKQAEYMIDCYEVELKELENQEHMRNWKEEFLVWTKY